jgi:hypothetical protein
MKLRYWRKLFIGVSAELRCCGKLMFGRAIPALLDFANVVTAGCKRRSYGGQDGGERGIRTLEGLLTLTPLAGVRLRPLGHLSGAGQEGGKNTGAAQLAQCNEL